MTTTLNSKSPFPTTTVHTIRLRLFQPTRRPRYLREIEIITPWGQVLATGRLGQSHADLLEAMCHAREAKARTEDGRIKLLVDPARVRRVARLGGEQLEKLSRELMEAVIQIKKPEELACLGHLVDHIDTAARADRTKITRYDPLTKGERNLWKVELGKAFCRLIQQDLWLGHNPALIAKLAHGITQAVARHVLTHKNQPAGGWKLDTLIHAVAGQMSPEALRHRRRELRNDASALEKIGIAIHGDRVIKTIEKDQD